MKEKIRTMLFELTDETLVDKDEMVLHRVRCIETAKIWVNGEDIQITQGELGGLVIVVDGLKVSQG